MAYKVIFDPDKQEFIVINQNFIGTGKTVQEAYENIGYR